MLALSGFAGTLYAQNDMGDSWRVGVNAQESTTHTRSGAFAFVRNPERPGAGCTHSSDRGDPNCE
ncbi:hypothetical protein HLY00_592 [Mycolicibacterium hippocampi]|uniref:Uncharacterized protein n=1 Tax=Mycolicibacterium hippocampi TaxID=659824 RepID=A0A850PJR4_9MYCO|nr:hypothetical protein [Mycolicibacterium hippocampi]